MPAKVVNMGRKLKVSYKSQQTSIHSYEYRQVPYICLCGQWLEQAGFNAGDNVFVMVKENELTITRQSTSEACRG